MKLTELEKQKLKKIGNKYNLKSKNLVLKSVLLGDGGSILKGKELLRFSGTIKKSDLDIMEMAIEEGCEISI